MPKIFDGNVSRWRPRFVTRSWMHVPLRSPSSHPSSVRRPGVRHRNQWSYDSPTSAVSHSSLLRSHFRGINTEHGNTIDSSDDNFVKKKKKVTIILQTSMRKREGSFVQTCFSRENSLAIEKGRTNRFSRILERSFEIERIYDSRLSLSLLSPLPLVVASFVSIPRRIGKSWRFSVEEFKAKRRACSWRKVRDRCHEGEKETRMLAFYDRATGFFDQHGPSPRFSFRPNLR